MRKRPVSDQQIALALQQAEHGATVGEVCRKLGISEQTFCRWKKMFAGMATERGLQAPRLPVTVSGGRRRSPVERIGAERVLFGSDFLHPEGLAGPKRFADLLEGRSQHEVCRVMRENAVELFAAAV